MKMKLTLYIVIYYIVICVDTLNTQVHEATKHTPYELVFGQPPRSLLIPDNKLVGRLNEEDLGEVNKINIIWLASSLNKIINGWIHCFR